MIRQGHLIAVVGAFLVAVVVVVGCANAQGNIDELGGEEGADATNEETTEPAGLDAEVVSPIGEANMPAGFGEGSLWATAAFGPGTDCGYDCVPGSMSGEHEKTNLKRVDPQTGEVVAKIDVGWGAVDVAVDENSGAVWVAGMSGSGHKPEQKKLTRVDPATNRVVAEIPIRAGASNVAVGEGAVWVSSGGKLVKVNPETNEVAGMVSVGAYYSQPVVYGGGVWAMVDARRGFGLVRVDPRTMHVVAYKTLRPFDNVAGAPGLAAGGGYVWFSSGKGLARAAP